MAKDRKYGVLTILDIPDDEPVFVLRAQDRFSDHILEHYERLVREGIRRKDYGADQIESARDHADGVKQARADFAAWPKKKMPD